MKRREFLRSSAALSALSLTNLVGGRTQAAAAATLDFGPPKPFDFAWLKGQARALASGTYKPPVIVTPKALLDLTYDQYQAIRYLDDHAVWFKDNGAYRLEFFHVGRGFKESVQMHEVVGGQAREIRYRTNLFDLSRTGIDTRGLKPDLGFAGFHVFAATNWQADVAAFLGASYFRAIGTDTRQFGLSARGLAIDTALDVEEFPRFTAWWFERLAPTSRTMIFYGLLDSPSVAGAYRFAMTAGAPTLIEVDACVYPRKVIRRLGIAPLTSMFQCSETDKRVAYDWRPEIHDSDGLSLWTGAGEWIWRPLNNPTGIRVNSFFDENPRGFGLLQRDRDFNNYQDDGVFYDRRPSLWIEPKGNWGKGAVQLVELPTADETFDNIVAYWNPAAPPKPGEELLYSYRMFWGTHMPANPPLAVAVDSRNGLGGIVGQKRRYFSWRFAVDFAGGELAGLAPNSKVEPVITVSRGTVEVTSARVVAAGPLKGAAYRAMFDLKPTDESPEPIDIRLFLKHGNQPLTENWVYQWTPPSPQKRKQALILSGDA